MGSNKTTGGIPHQHDYRYFEAWIDISAGSSAFHFTAAADQYVELLDFIVCMHEATTVASNEFKLGTKADDDKFISGLVLPNPTAVGTYSQFGTKAAAAQAWASTAKHSTLGTVLLAPGEELVLAAIAAQADRPGELHVKVPYRYYSERRTTA